MFKTNHRARLALGSMFAGLVLAFLVGPVSAYGQQSTADALIDRLVDKGILTKEEAKLLRTNSSTPAPKPIPDTTSVTPSAPTPAPTARSAGASLFVRGGEMDTISPGVNWHFNANTRAMFNYIYADVETGAGADGGIHTSKVASKWISKRTQTSRASSTGGALFLTEKWKAHWDRHTIVTILL